MLADFPLLSSQMEIAPMTMTAPARAARPEPLHRTTGPKPDSEGVPGSRSGSRPRGEQCLMPSHRGYTEFPAEKSPESLRTEALCQWWRIRRRTDAVPITAVKTWASRMPLSRKESFSLCRKVYDDEHQGQKDSCQNAQQVAGQASRGKVRQKEEGNTKAGKGHYSNIPPLQRGL